MARSGVILALFVGMLAAAVPSALSQPLQSGDIVVPGINGLDNLGHVVGCIYRIRDDVVTPLFQSDQYSSPHDMVVDDQGRLVFIATPMSRNALDIELFRIDPATGILEPLWYFPAIVQAGDTLPHGAESATGFLYPNMRQSLHLESSLSVSIVDDQNGGWPQIQNNRSYGFSIYPGTDTAPRTFRYRPNTGICEAGVDVSPFPIGGNVYMVADGSTIYYGFFNMVGQTGAPAQLNIQLDGDWGTLDASVSLPPQSELILTGSVFDNLRYPNGLVVCGDEQDADVPFDAGTNGFMPLAIQGLGVLGGALYSTASGSQSINYVFGLSPRGIWLSPYSCGWYTADKGDGQHDNVINGVPTGSIYSSTDGNAVLGMGAVPGGAAIKRATPGGGFEVVHGGFTAGVPYVGYTGRPWRWNEPASSLAVDAEASAQTGSQVLVVRIDALANVVLTSPSGKRIGFDAQGAEVNEFGASGILISGPAGGWPRVIALRDPEAGVHETEVHITGAGDWSATAYLANENGATARQATSGSAPGAGTAERVLNVGQPASVHWYQSATGVEPGEAPVAGFASVGPVPSRGTVRFVYHVPDGGTRIRLEVLDIAGRRVALLAEGASPGGTHSVSWSGLGTEGQRLPRGIYFARLDLDCRRDTRRIVFLE